MEVRVYNVFPVELFVGAPFLFYYCQSHSNGIETENHWTRDTITVTETPIWVINSV